MQQLVTPVAAPFHLKTAKIRFLLMVLHIVLAGGQAVCLEEH